jgi:hypothetical protein
MLHRSNEAALQNLIVEHGIAASEDEFPDTLQLPDTIHARSLDALEATTQDGSERSISFYHWRQKWLTGLAFKGTPLRVAKDGDWEATEGWLSYNSRALLPMPHVSMHTHPAPLKEIVQVSNTRRAKLQNWDAEKIAHQNELDWRAMQISIALPSWPDTVNSYLGRCGTVANLLCSAGGLSLNILRPNPEPFTLTANLTPDKKIQADSFWINLFFPLWQAAEFQPTSSSLAEMQTDLAFLEAALLVRKRVCYRSTDPHDPVLTRTHVRAVELSDLPAKQVST